MREISLRRDFSYNDSDTLSKESEEALLYRDMQSDAVSHYHWMTGAQFLNAVALGPDHPGPGRADRVGGR